MPRIEITTHVHAPIEVCFDAARSIDLHMKSTKHTGEQAIAGRTTGLIELGETVTWLAKHFGLWQTLTSKITEMDRPNYFVDEMVDGAFHSFRHEHHFTMQDGHVVMKDIFNYKSPLGVLGKLADRLFLEVYMRNLLLVRNEVVKKYAEQKEIDDIALDPYAIMSVRARIAYALVLLSNLYDARHISRQTIEYKYISNWYWLLIAEGDKDFEMITPTIEVIPGPVTRVWEEQNYAHLLSKEEEEKLLKTNLEGLPETYEIKVLENKIETLYKYFQELPGDVNECLEILGHIVEAGMDAGGDGANMKGGSYQYLMAAIALAKKYTTNIPNPEDFTYSVYKVRNGWGCAVYKHEIEEKLGISL